MTTKTSKVVRVTTNNNAAAPTESLSNTDFSQTLLDSEVAAALDSNDATAIAKAQLKVSLAIVTQLNKIDWKLWEFYNRLGK